MKFNKNRFVPCFLVLCFLGLFPKHLFAGDFGIGFSLGNSYAIKDQSYGKEAWSSYPGYEHFNTADPKACWKISANWNPNGSKSGLSLRYFRQNYIYTMHTTMDFVEVWTHSYKDSFSCLEIFANYDFFSNENAILTPFIAAGVSFLLYISFGGAPPQYPGYASFIIEGGARLKIVKMIYLNVSASYRPSNSILSLALGLEFRSYRGWTGPR